MSLKDGSATKVVGKIAVGESICQKPEVNGRRIGERHDVVPRQSDHSLRRFEKFEHVGVGDGGATEPDQVPQDQLPTTVDELDNDDGGGRDLEGEHL